ncbi:MAG: glycosyltransferase family 39 protein [Verrucomicrobiota bacterium]
MELLPTHATKAPTLFFAILSSILKTLESFLRKNESLFLILLCVASACVHFYVSILGWNNPLLDQFNHRQTQTAITTFYTIKEGFKLHYITPVLGAPWSIPFEFPLFQWIVAAIVLLFKTSLDQTGRFVSLMFFYLSLVPLFAILKSCLKKKSLVLIILSLTFLNPTYLFWSRTFMIESLAYFLGISYVWLSIRAFQTRKWKYFAAVPIIGSLAALVKITTFLVLCMPVGCLFVYLYFSENKRLLPSIYMLKKYALYGILTFIIPLYTGSAWTHIADAQKKINPLANDFITSKALTSWNFGTLHQKLDPAVWGTIFKNSLLLDNTFGSMCFGTLQIPNSIVLILLFLVFSKMYRKEVLLSFLFFLSGPLIFTNLYFVHTYYFYANSIFLSILLGYIIIAFYSHNDMKIKCLGTFILFPSLLISMIFSYKIAYYPRQIMKDNEYPILNTSAAIKKYTKPDDVIFIYGQDWNPSLPYYAQRKAIMDWKLVPLNDNYMTKSLLKTGNISAFVISNSTDEKFIKEQVQHLGFNEIPVYQDNQDRLYLPK